MAQKIYNSAMFEKETLLHFNRLHSLESNLTKSGFLNILLNNYELNKNADPKIPEGILPKKTKKKITN